MRRLAFIAVPVVPLLLACGREPVAPPAVGAPSFDAANPATTEWRHYSELWDWIETVPCRGDAEFRFHGDVDISWHLLWNPQGPRQFQLKILPTDTFVGQELSTGTVFAVRPGTTIVVHDVEGPDKGGTWWVRNKLTYEAPNGDKITWTSDYHLSWNATGDPVVHRDRGEYGCTFGPG